MHLISQYSQQSISKDSTSTGSASWIQPMMKRKWLGEKFQKVPKSKTSIRCILTTIHMALILYRTFLVSQMVKNLPAMLGAWGRSLGWEDPLEEGMATHSSILAWRITRDRRGWQVTVHGVAESRTQLSD